MKASFSLVTGIFLLFVAASPSVAQEFSTARSVRLSSTILTQGPDASVTTVNGGTTITTKRVVTTSFGNRDVMGMMVGRHLIPGPVTGWELIYLADLSGKGNFYAAKTGLAPVVVPEDLLTVPEFVAKVAGGMIVTGAEGADFGGISETAFATLSVGGVKASGLASGSGDQGHTVSPESTTTTLTFAGGASDADGDRLVKGVIVIGSPKALEPVSTVAPALK